MKWFGGPLGLYEQPRTVQVEVLGLLRELFGSPISDAAVAYLLGVTRAPRSSRKVSEVRDVVPELSDVSSGSQERGAARSFPRPPWLVALTADAATRGDHFRVRPERVYLHSELDDRTEPPSGLFVRTFSRRLLQTTTDF